LSKQPLAKASNETLGGATHCEISGVTDYKDDKDALDKIKTS
jgi:acetyl-CoA carboxylase carboxyltransferase component